MNYKLKEEFAELVFNDAVMKERLPEDIYRKLRSVIRHGQPLSEDIAGVVASAMKEWALEKGATHYTHWFQPLNGVTAEKHDSFIAPDGHGGVLLEFSAKALVKGESDASSFPSGGLRATFEARGYTAWDPTSYAFIKDGTLCIPTAFCSYAGEALDKKTPLLRSMDAIDRQALRILRLFGNDSVQNVFTTVGPEQEYFLVDKSVWEKRPDLVLCGRTLIGARPPKGQELEDHYYGTIKPRVQAFMKELDTELWKLGVYAKTEHNEVAPGQHELATVFTSANLAADHNQLTMELMKRIAERHGMVCLLHEKPFKGVNGSGKHNNWSLATDKGKNLFEPGDTPAQNDRFLLFLTAVIKAVDMHQDLLRISVASASNDHRLGGNEAPPSIISIFLGDELTDILSAIEEGREYKSHTVTEMGTGTKLLPHFPKDSTDRNRTAPIAFTGNKFEFRSPGASASISGANIVLNTIVADVLQEFADRLESSEDFDSELSELMRETLSAHKRILFNGNSYSDEWRREAQERGLLNVDCAASALKYFESPENIALFERQGVLSGAEIHSRCEIMYENYVKTIQIEALTLIDMVNHDIAPAVMRYEGELARNIAAKKAVMPELTSAPEKKRLRTLSGELDKVMSLAQILENCMEKFTCDNRANAILCHDNLINYMEMIREHVDCIEKIMPAEQWPYPTYADILFSVR